MTSTITNRVINALKIASIQYPHEEFLRKRVEEKEQSTFVRVDKLRYEAKIDYYFSLQSNESSIRRRLEQLNLKEMDIRNTVKVREYDKLECIKEVAQKASIYFHQALEMYQTSIKMPETTSPLVEYYALLQCVKGSIILDLDLIEDVFFRFHGIVPVVKEEGNYIRARVKPIGVFSALVIRFAGYQDQRDDNGNSIQYKNEMETYFRKIFIISLEDIVNPPSSSAFEISYSNPLSVFMGSWMLSNLVRYAPLSWQEILAGQKNDLLYYIRDFRDEEIPRIFESCLPDHIRMKAGRRPPPKTTK